MLYFNCLTLFLYHSLLLVTKIIILLVLNSTYMYYLSKWELFFGEMWTFDFSGYLELEVVETN